MGKGMSKRILIGSMLVLVMLLLMPSIPAVQQKTIEDKAYSDLVEKLKDLEVLDGDMKFPILFAFVYTFARIQITRAFKILDFALTENWYGVKHPLFALYGLWIFFVSVRWVDFWAYYSDELEWNWDW